MFVLPVLALALTATQPAEPAATEVVNTPPPNFILQPDWVSTPQGADVMRLFPTEAVKTGTSGQAIVQCGVLADGSLDRCEVVAEQPQGLGFGEASVELATAYRMKSVTLDGQPVDGGQILIPFAWNLGSR